jgi:hypothetical protein
VLDTEAVDENETVKFDKITYTEKDAGKTYTYTITEEGTLPGGLTQSGQDYSDCFRNRWRKREAKRICPI